MSSKTPGSLSITSLLLFTVLFTAILTSFVQADCGKIRFSDVGWTDITATTAVASVLLQALGYETHTTQLSVPITYASLKNRDIDLFLGSWLPSMAADIAPYIKEGSVENLGTLLKGARYSLAVPDYVKEAGVHSVADLAKFKDKFSGKIYGIEAGNDGNRHIQDMITHHQFGLGGWTLVESSEQAMLMEVLQAVKHQKWIVFLGWEPHPMNTKMKMTYLKGTDQYFGPNEGSSTVSITARKQYSKECPQVAQFFKNFQMNVHLENELMSLILDQKLHPETAARQWMKQNPKQVHTWLKGIHARNGQDAVNVITKQLL